MMCYGENLKIMWFRHYLTPDKYLWVFISFFQSGKATYIPMVETKNYLLGRAGYMCMYICVYIYIYKNMSLISHHTLDFSVLKFKCYFFKKKKSYCSIMQVFENSTVSNTELRILHVLIHLNECQNNDIGTIIIPIYRWRN